MYLGNNWCPIGFGSATHPSLSLSLFASEDHHAFVYKTYTLSLYRRRFFVFTAFVLQDFCYMGNIYLSFAFDSSNFCYLGVMGICGGEAMLGNK